MNNIQHFSALKELHVCYDITTASSSAKINGSALFYNGSTDNLKSPTGFGMFKDKVGNLIIVADEKTKSSKTLLNGKLLGYSNWNEVKANCPIINLGNTTKNVFGNDDITRTDRAKLISQGVVNGGYFGNWKYGKPDGNNFYDVLTRIESKGEKHDNPIILYWSYSEANSFTDVLGYALAIASSFAGPLGISEQVFKDASNLLKIWANKSATTNPTNLFNSLAMTSELLLPEWTKGANAKIEQAKIKFGKYLDQAKTGYEALQSNLTNNTFISQFTNITGVDRIEVQKFLVNIKSGQFQNVVDLRKINGSLANANKTFAGVNASFTNELVKIKMSYGDRLLEDIHTTGLSAFDVPVINNIFQSGTASTILQGVVGADKIIPEVIKKERKSLSVNNLAGLIGANFGYVGPEDNFDTMTLNALITQAQSYAINKIPFVLPDTIPISKREKFADEVKKSTGVDVIGYEDKWDYDTNLRKMMPLGIAVAVGGGLWYAKKKNIL
jgi:hypothetical protein